MAKLHKKNRADQGLHDFYLTTQSATYFTSSNLKHIDYQRIMFVWDKYGRFKLLFYKQKVCI